MMLTRIARFEFGYVLRNPLLWITAAGTFAFWVVSISTDVGAAADAGLMENAPAMVLRNYLVVSLVFMFVTTSFVANVVIRDDETGFGPIIRSTPITTVEYLIGRFAGAFAVAALTLLAVPAAMWIGSLLPWADPATLGPNRLADHVYGYFLIGLPNLFITAAIFFALATLTRSMMGTYLGVIALVSAYSFLEKALSGRLHESVIGIADPFGARPLMDSMRYWTIPQRNTLLPEFAGILLYNRLLWLGVAVLFLVLACAIYRSADQGATKRERKRQKLVERADAGTPLVAYNATLPSPQHGSAALRALVWMRTKFEVKQVVKSPAFVILMFWGLFITFFVLTTQRDPDGRPSYPTTMSMIPEIAESFAMVLIIVAIYYASEVVWRERDRKVHEIIDPAPFPNWAYVVSKTIALAVVLLGMVAVSAISSIIVQLSLGYTRLELGEYLLWYVLPESFDMLLIAALAVFVQSVSRHKTIGWGVMVLFVMWRAMTMGQGHNLLHFGAVPDVPLSDINGGMAFWQGAWTVRIYWGALALLMLVAAHVLWRRGTETRLKPRLAHARRRLTGAPGWVAAIALLIFVTSGAYAYYNTNILNDYRTKEENQARAADFEKRYWKYHEQPQPTIASLTLDIALYPEARRAITKGHAELRNTTSHTISDVHVRMLEDDTKLTQAAIDGAEIISRDTIHSYLIFKLAEPMRPGEQRRLSFESERWHRGFTNGYPPTKLVENGTFMTTSALMPGIGMSREGKLMDPVARKKHGLPEMAVPKLEDLSNTMRASNGQTWAKADITVSTSADQTPIAPGRKVFDVTRAGRRTARFVSEAPILLLFSVQSARYAEKHRQHAGIDLSVYYHRGHEWNVERLLDAMAASLDYYQANFGAYQFGHVRIVEFPGFAYFAQALPGTIAYSEDLGFVSDFRAPETIDHVTLVTAHELAHQYWGHQLRGAETEGANVLTETLSQYSAMMVAKKLYGEDRIRRALQFQLNQYLQGREYSPPNEPPLARVLGQNHIHSRKGAVVMYLLQQRMGEEAINRALRGLLQKYRFQGPPYPRSTDLIDALRAEAQTPELQALITDLFERVTLYDLKVEVPRAVRRADGKWDVTVPIEAKKSYVQADGAEKEAPLDERIEVGLFTAEPGRDAFDKAHVIMLERQPIRSGKQVLTFVTDRKPNYAGIDPYNFYIDQNAGDNVVAVGQ